jgi:acyl-CoA reductase-like NAD-dependent aldehyde dehydrogenase
MIEFINKRPHPLALYIFSKDKTFVNQVIAQTHSGGVCVNDLIVHLAHSGLPFGGVGPSGMGSYHGQAGFAAFSNYKPVLHQGFLGFLLTYFYPPITKNKSKIFRWIMNHF